MKLAIALVTLSLTVLAAPNPRAERRVRVGTEILEARQDSRNAIPEKLLASAQCVASVRLVKAGFIFGGEGSVGVVSCRTRDGSWSAPSFLNLGGASVGLQIGLQFVDSVLLFMTEQSRSVLTRGSFKLGTDLSLALGPVGQGVGLDVTPNAHVLSYNRTRGLFAGLTFSGVVMAHAPVLNADTYGERATPKAILETPIQFAPALVQPYGQALTELTK